MDIAIPDIHAFLLAGVGGVILGVAMFRLLPGMKSNAYQPREWVPVGITLNFIVWLTYFLPQITFNALQGIGSLERQFIFVGLLFFTYSFITFITLYTLQRRRRD